MRTVLMVSYIFPPLAGGGVQRTVKFTKYLLSFNWKAIVLTINRNFDQIEYSDNSLLKELPQNLQIYRSEIIEPFEVYRVLGGKQKMGSRSKSLLHKDEGSNDFTKNIKKLILQSLIPDSKIGWFPLAVKSIKKILQNHQVDIIYSTSPPNTSHLIARYVSKRHRIPWVADFRDPWQRFIENRPILFEKIDRYLERKVLLSATKYLVAWPGIIKSFKKRHNCHNPEKCEVIFNGFDQDDFLNLKPSNLNEFTITYTGTIYNERALEGLFKGLRLLFEENSELRTKINVLFICVYDPILKDLVNKYQLVDVVKSIPYMNHKDCVSYLKGSHLLFLYTTRLNAVPGKLFDYLGAKRPILAIVPADTTVAEIIKSTETGFIVNPNDEQGIKKTIKKIYHNYDKIAKRISNINIEALKDFERKHQTERLAKLFNAILDT